MPSVHRYTVACSWEGSTGAGYDRYQRAHSGSAPPALTELTLSSDPAFRGDPARLNPEQIFVLASSSCQLLSFLAVAARARLDVRRYQDHAEAEMPEAFVPVLERARGAALVNVLTVVSLTSRPVIGGYAASKAAAYSVTQALRASLKPRGIDVHAVFWRIISGGDAVER
jgi:hypothetical protein